MIFFLHVQKINYGLSLKFIIFICLKNKNKIFLNYNRCKFLTVGSKNLASSVFFISSPRAMPRKKKCLRKNWGAKEFGNPGSFHIKPKCHVKEEEMFDDKRRRFKLPKDIAEDNPVLNQLKSSERRAACL